ncbi:hypothetical protein [Flavobacterium gelatinilyticum]|uniref:hypothetical protein n=1 Tax=Flavobacterium gelatinilyticum TaxID=3003260 RepID=UPI002480BBF0|nr:hypothetical protein [Flavobacterium gelatinilyticum]
MKKTALTFGLLSVAIAATSFANPTTPAAVSNENVSIIPPIDGNGTRDGRHKADFAGTTINSDVNYGVLSSFNADSQSTRINVKLD